MEPINTLERRIQAQAQHISLLTKEVRILNNVVKRITDELIKQSNEIEALYG